MWHLIFLYFVFVKICLNIFKKWDFSRSHQGLILCYVILYFLYYIIVYCILWFCTILCYIKLYYVILYYIIDIILYSIVLYCIVLHCIVLSSLFGCCTSTLMTRCRFFLTISKVFLLFSPQPWHNKAKHIDMQSAPSPSRESKALVLPCWGWDTVLH